MRTRVAIAVALLCACAKAQRSPSAGEAAAFVMYPADEVAGVQDPHAFRGRPLCQRCHEAGGRLVAGPVALCLQCHSFQHSNHPVDVTQRGDAGGLPLLAGGEVACHTCHDPHRKGEVLRKPFNELCRSCHAPHGRG